MKARLVIERIGGGVLRQTARKLGLPVMTVQNWKKRGNVVPEWRRAHIRSVAYKMGVSLEPPLEAKKDA